MKIEIMTVVGSPRGVSEKTIHGDGVQFGVGGAELYLLTMCHAWKEAGHDVILYNNPREQGASIFEQRDVNDFKPQDGRDVFIYFRGGNVIPNVNAKRKVFWSCDQFSQGDYVALAGNVDRVVTISNFHAEYFQSVYNIVGTKVIDIPVRGWEYQKQVEKNQKQVLFCSVPDRGIIELAAVWKLVNAEVPDAQLHITSDYRLWDASMSPNHIAPHRLRFSDYENVYYHALVPREELVELQLQSAIQLYPCTYQELFCIATAECQYAGCFPITSTCGSLLTTNMGIKIPYPVTDTEIKTFARHTIEALTYPEVLEVEQRIIQDAARERFSIERAIEQWDTVFSM